MEYSEQDLNNINNARMRATTERSADAFTTGTAVRVRRTILGLRLRTPPLLASSPEHHALVKQMYKEASEASTISVFKLRAAVNALPKIGQDTWSKTYGPDRKDLAVMTREEKRESIDASFLVRHVVTVPDELLGRNIIIMDCDDDDDDVDKIH